MSEREHRMDTISVIRKPSMMNQASRAQSFYREGEVIKEVVCRTSIDGMIAYPISPRSDAAALIGELLAEGYIGDYFRHGTLA